MDDLTRAFYEQNYIIQYISKRGNEFQDFFSDIMEHRYPSDFQRYRPWGKAGDKKNDGYLRSKRTLFQLYAPNEVKEYQTIKKIDEDFKEALPYWQSHFNIWVFVHNSKSGLSPNIGKKLLDLAHQNPNITFQNWGYEELRKEVFNLLREDLALVLGPVPSIRGIMQLRLEDLKPLLHKVAEQLPMDDGLIRPVPPDKLDQNGLSNSVKLLLRMGMAKSDLVKEYFDNSYDPRLGDKVGKAFKEQYLELKSQGLLPDDIYYRLQIFIGGIELLPVNLQSAVQAVLAYFFNSVISLKIQAK